MIKYQIVIPYVDEAYAEECLKTLKLPSSHILAVNNTQQNKGVAGSWNLGIDMAKARKAEWLIIISASMRFGEAGGKDMIEAVTKRPDCEVIRFAEKQVPEQNFDKLTAPTWHEGGFYWHCTAINMDTIKKVGKFDTNFYPIYFEDTDYDLRIKKAGLLPDIIYPIDAHSTGTGAALKQADIEVDTDKLVAYFATKWGSHPNAMRLGTYDKPFDNAANGLDFFPPAHGGIYNE